VADAGRERVAEGQGRERREAAGAPTFDREPVRVDVAALDQEPRRSDRVVDIDDAPLPVELAADVAAVGLPGVVEGFAEDVLCMVRQMVANRSRQVGVLPVRRRRLRKAS